MANGPAKTAAPSLTERFNRLVAPVAVTGGCATWTGAKRKASGAGIFMLAPGYNVAANRCAYVLAHAEPLAPSQVIEPKPTCATGGLCVNGAHWQLARTVRHRPSRIKRYSPEARADFVKFALALGISEMSRLFGCGEADARSMGG